MVFYCLVMSLEQIATDPNIFYFIVIVIFAKLGLLEEKSVKPIVLVNFEKAWDKPTEKDVYGFKTQLRRPRRPAGRYNAV